MTKLIALVTVAIFVAGVRTEFAPSSELPELPEHDVKELKRMGAVEDVTETATANKATAKEEARAGADFQAERQAIRAINASIRPDKTAGNADPTPAEKKR